MWATIFLDILNVMGSYGVISISFDGHLKIPFKLQSPKCETTVHLILDTIELQEIYFLKEAYY